MISRKSYLPCAYSKLFFLSSRSLNSMIYHMIESCEFIREGFNWFFVLTDLNTQIQSKDDEIATFHSNLGSLKSKSNGEHLFISLFIYGQMMHHEVSSIFFNLRHFWYNTGKEPKGFRCIDVTMWQCVWIGSVQERRMLKNGNKLLVPYLKRTSISGHGCTISYCISK